ncbi:hypothetical protein [Dongia deserti]|uniref:hypothetical protein n=1 Tax=Dongia deserti TaxID=2268030 RepID=UPI000E650026|nr:hypothetical protein [Dongia deserti]
MQRRRAQLEESVVRYLDQLGTADRHEPTEALATKAEHLKEKLSKLRDYVGRRRPSSPARGLVKLEEFVLQRQLPGPERQ